MVSREESRSLRSKGTDDELADNRFDFEKQEYSIDPHKKFVIHHSRVARSKNDGGNRVEEKPKANPSSDVPDVTTSKNLISSMTLHIKKHGIARGGIGKVSNPQLIDPLNDDIFTSFHKKMLRQENRMHQVDVTQSADEADRLTLIYDKLNMPSWVGTLQKVAVINNPNDDEELLSKKKMVKRHIRALLKRYNRMQKRNHVLNKEMKGIKLIPIRRTPKIYRNLDRKCDVEYHSSSDDEEDESDIDNAEIHRRRLLRREAQAGGSIVIGLNSHSLNSSHFAIVAEPLRKPYLILSSPEERKIWKSLTGMPKYLKYGSQLNDQIAVMKQKVPIPLTLTVDDLAKKQLPDVEVNTDVIDTENSDNWAAEAPEEIVTESTTTEDKQDNTITHQVNTIKEEERPDNNGYHTRITHNLKPTYISKYGDIQDDILNSIVSSVYNMGASDDWNGNITEDMYYGLNDGNRLNSYTGPTTHEEQNPKMEIDNTNRLPHITLGAQITSTKRLPPIRRLHTAYIPGKPETIERPTSLSSVANNPFDKLRSVETSSIVIKSHVSNNTGNTHGKSNDILVSNSFGVTERSVEGNSTQDLNQKRIKEANVNVLQVRKKPKSNPVS